MEGTTKFLSWKKTASRNWLQKVEENEEEVDHHQGQKCESTLPTIPQPETPREPMEFLSRSWSLSASEISKALAAQNHFNCNDGFENKLKTMPQLEIPQQRAKKPLNQANNRKPRTITRWFHHKKTTSHNTMKKKDIARMENAHMHTALSIAGLASALASFAAIELNRNEPKLDMKMSTALASATELLASHCIELAESAGADNDRIVSVIRSAMGGSSASNLVTLTAAAATALRGEAALKARLPKEPKRNAAITPCEKGFVDTTLSFAESDFNAMQDIEAPPCVGDLLHYTRKGVFQWKQVSVYISKKSQVMIKIKGKKAGAFTKKKKYVVYDVCNETTGMKAFKKEAENQEVYFGVKTAQGVLEFKCKNKVHKQKWINEIQDLLLNRSSCIEDVEHSMRMLTTNRSI